MSLTLRYSSCTALPADIRTITPDRLRQRSLTEIERTEIVQGNRTVRLAELFRLSGDPSDGVIEFEGNLSGVHHVGAEMVDGRIVVRGNAGRHLGAGMSGGAILVEGDAGDWTGAEMKGGLIHIRGSVGDNAGAAYAGSRRGMTDGTIIIDGAGGDGVARSMRRGLVTIGGSCGEHAGFGLIAGTILVFGACGSYPGAEMKRGTIGIFGAEPPRLLPTFRRAGRFRPLFLRLIQNELERVGSSPLLHKLPEVELTLYHGDLLSLGKGEVWVRDDGGAP